MEPTRDREVPTDGDESPSNCYDPLSRAKPDPSKSKKLSFYHDDDDDDDEYSTETSATEVSYSIEEHLNEVREKIDIQSEEQVESLPKSSSQEAEDKGETVTCDSDSNLEIDYEQSKEEKLREIRAQILKLKQQFEENPTTKTLSERRIDDHINDRRISQEQSDVSQSSVTSRSKSRERETIKLVTNFKKKLKEASRKPEEKLPGKQDFDPCDNVDETLTQNEIDLMDAVCGDAWLTHKFDLKDEDKGKTTAYPFEWVPDRKRKSMHGKHHTSSKKSSDGNRRYLYGEGSSRH